MDLASVLQEKEEIVGIESLIEPQLNDSCLVGMREILNEFLPKLVPIYTNSDLNDKKYDKFITQYEKEISNLLSGRFGFTIDFRMERQNKNTFYTVFSVPDDNVINSGIKKNKLSDKELINILKNNITKLKKREYLVDRKNASIHGTTWYKTIIVGSIPTMIELYQKNNIDGIIAIILHEVGHNFTMLEYLNNTIKFNITLLDSIQYVGIKNDKSKKILESYKKKHKSDLQGIKRVLEDQDFLVRESERQADDFVTKFGLAGALTEGLSHLTKNLDSKFYVKELVKNMETYIYSLIMELSISSLFPVLYLLIASGNFNILIYALVESGSTLILTVLMAIIFACLEFLGIKFLSVKILNAASTYDDLKTRMELSKRKTIELLSKKKISDREASILIKEIDKIQMVIDRVKDTKLTGLAKTIAKAIDNNTEVKNQLTGRNKNIIYQKLINNDMFLEAKRLELAGKEEFKHNYLHNIDPGYYLSYVFNPKKNKGLNKDIESINSVLMKHNIYLANKNDNVYTVSDKIVDISDGATTISILRDKKRISLTIDNLKLMWQMYNPEIKIYSLDKIKLTNFNKYLYAVHHENNELISDKIGDKINEINVKLYDHYDMYGEPLSVLDAIDRYIKIVNDSKVKLPGLTEQLTLLHEFLKEHNHMMTTSARIDLHKFNFSIKNNKIVILDPFIDFTTIALMNINDIPESAIKLDKK